MPNLERRRRKLQRSLERLPRKLESFAKRVTLAFRPSAKTLIAFHVDGGLGDHICAARFIRDVVAELGDVEYDVYCKLPAIGDWLFKDAVGCRFVANHKADFKLLRFSYAAILYAYTFVYAERPSMRITKNSKAESRLDALLKTLESSSKPLKQVIANYPQLDGYLGHYAAIKGFRRHNFLHHMAGISYGGDCLPLEVEGEFLSRLELIGIKYVTINNGYDREMSDLPTGPATKVYPRLAEVVHILKNADPDLRIVQIGTQTSTEIPGVDVNLIEKTSLKEVAAVLKNTCLHIDGEGGLVHLAAALGAKSCVIFGPTLASYFGYDGNVNLPPNVCGGCWWMESNWMFKCVRGDITPECMTTHPPQAIADQVIAHLRDCLGHHSSHI